MVHNGIANPKTVIGKLHQKFPMAVLGFYNYICLDRLPDATRAGIKNYSSASMPHGLKALALTGCVVPSLTPPTVGSIVSSPVNPETALLLIPLPDSDAKRLSMSITFSFIEGFTYIFFIAV